MQGWSINQIYCHTLQAVRYRRDQPNLQDVRLHGTRKPYIAFTFYSAESCRVPRLKFEKFQPLHLYPTNHSQSTSNTMSTVFLLIMEY